MRGWRLLAASVVLLPVLVGGVRAPTPAAAYEVSTYTVYCADRHIEVSMWDLEQMKVRRGSDVCQFTTYTSYSDALDFAEKNFGGEGADCSC